MATLPVDASFFHAFVGSAVALPESFTRGWEEAWNAIAASDSHPGAFERWQYFKKREGIATLEEHNVRQGFFERGEFVAFRTALPDYLKPAVTFAYFTDGAEARFWGSSGI